MRLKYSKLTEKQTVGLLGRFVEGTPARAAADMASLNRNTVRDFYHKIREIIAWRVEAKWPLDGEIDVDASYFGDAAGGRRRGGAGGKVPLFGIVGRGGGFYIRPVVDSPAIGTAMPPIQRKKIHPDSIVYSQSWREDATVDIPELRHRIYRNRLATGQPNRMNEVAHFWNRVKMHLERYNGVPAKRFNLFLKECEWRINFGPPEFSPPEQVEQLERWINLHNEHYASAQDPFASLEQEQQASRD